MDDCLWLALRVMEPVLKNIRTARGHGGPPEGDVSDLVGGTGASRGPNTSQDPLMLTNELATELLWSAAGREAAAFTRTIQQKDAHNG